MSDLLNKLISNKTNSVVLKYLKINLSDGSLLFRNWEQSHSGFDEEGVALFDKFGRNIPIKCKYSLGIHNVLINPDTGEFLPSTLADIPCFLK